MTWLASFQDFNAFILVPKQIKGEAKRPHYADSDTPLSSGRTGGFDPGVCACVNASVASLRTTCSGEPKRK